MENKYSIILRINLSDNQCAGRKWTKNLLESRSESYSCLKGGNISPAMSYPGMKAFIRLDSELKYNNTIYKDIQIQCKVINSRKDSRDPVDIELVYTFDENNRINNSHLQSIGIDLIHGHRGHRYTDRGDEIQNHGLGIQKISK